DGTGAAPPGSGNARRRSSEGSRAPRARPAAGRARQEADRWRGSCRAPPAWAGAQIERLGCDPVRLMPLDPGIQQLHEERELVLAEVNTLLFEPRFEELQRPLPPLLLREVGIAGDLPDDPQQ